VAILEPLIPTINDRGAPPFGWPALEDVRTTTEQVGILASQQNSCSSGHIKTMHRPLCLDEVTITDRTRHSGLFGYRSLPAVEKGLATHED